MLYEFQYFYFTFIKKKKQHNNDVISSCLFYKNNDLKRFNYNLLNRTEFVKITITFSDNFQK